MESTIPDLRDVLEKPIEETSVQQNLTHLILCEIY